MAVETSVELELLTGVGRKAGYKDYISLARFDHITKQIFILPGIALAELLRGVRNDHLELHVFLGVVCAVAIASANYVINEWLDREYDKYHPTKSSRTSVNVALRPVKIFVLYGCLLLIGLGAAYLSSWPMLFVGLVFAAQGVVYNVPPLRSKDRAYIDVLSESINNPIRLLIGWLMIDAGSVPPSSVIIAYWLGGGFLMAAKRLSEYREIAAAHGLDLLVRYRRSFSGYTEISLFASAFLYALLSVSMFAIFLIKYRIEYALLLPFLCTLFAVYMALAMRVESVAQAPERIFTDRTLMTAVAVFTVALILLTVVDLPFLETFTTARYVLVR